MDDTNIVKKKGKTQKTRRETAVQGTNDSSIVSKCSMAATGYVDDKFLHYFVTKTARRAPLIHWGYYIRTKTVNRIVINFLQRYASVKKQIVSLGAGFDSAYFKLKSLGKLENTAYIEVDFPEVMKRKHTIIINTPELKNLLGHDQTPQAPSPHIELNCQDYKMLGVDLTQLNTLEAALRLCHVDFDIPTLILSECVLTYLTRRCSSAVVKWAGETFTESAFVLYEQINPNDAFGLFMQHHYHVVGSPLKCINSFPTLKSQNDRFTALGWEWSEAFDMNQFYRDLVSVEEKRHISSLEPFDEYEEWHLKCSHYFLLCAYSTACVGLMSSDELSPDENVNFESIRDKVVIKPCEQSYTIKRFSHTSSQLKTGLIVIIGGFGEQDGRHQRISNVHVMDPSTMKCSTIEVDNGSELSRMHQSADVLSDNSVLVFGGRNSPFRLCSQSIILSFSQTSTETESEMDVADARCDTKSNCEMNGKITPKSGSEQIENDARGDNTEARGDNKAEPNFKMDMTVLDQTGDVPCLRWRHATTIVEFEGKEFMFLYGGRSSKDPSLEDSFLLDPHTSHWRQLNSRGDHPNCRQSHTVTTWGHKVILFGGLDYQLLPLNTIHILDLISLTWTRLEVKGSLLPRYSHTAHLVDDILVVIGGVNLSQGAPGIGLVDLHTGKSFEYALPPAQKNALVMVHKHSSVDIGDGCVMIVGGGGNCFSFGSHLNMSPFVIDINLCFTHFKETV